MSFRSGYAPVNGLEMYYEVHGATNDDAPPLVLLHGGFGSTGMFADLIPELLRSRQVIAADMQAHGRTADIDRPLTMEAMGGDVAALVEHLGFGQVDVLGYSLGAGVGLQAAFQRPDLVRRLVVVSIPMRRGGWYPGVLATQDRFGPDAAEGMKPSPMHRSYAQIAPRPEEFPRLVTKMAHSMQQDYDWSDDVRRLPMPVLFVAADADGFPPTHAAEVFSLLGGGLRDPGWDGNPGRPASQLAILPGTSHYDVLDAPALPALVERFLQ